MTDLPPARILEVSPDSYHRLPGFSASLAKIVISRSAAHAKDAYDRQLERIADEDESDGDEDMPADKRKRLDSGNIYHALVLGIGKRIEIIPQTILAKNGAISTADAKALVKAARDSGRIPVKEADLEIHQQVANAMKARIAAAGHVLDGTSELAIEWWEQTPHGPVQCRSMMDHVVVWGVPLNTAGIVTSNQGAPGAIIYDLKTCGDAHPERCMRTAESFGYAIAACAYERALTALYPQLGGRIHFQFLWCETRRPYALWDPHRLSGAFREIGERRWVRARNAWAEVLATGKAPSYREMGHNEMTAPMWTLRSEGYASDEL
jgi:hypothetical protein